MHDRSASGNTFFIEPIDILELNGDVFTTRYSFKVDNYYICKNYENSSYIGKFMTTSDDESNSFIFDETTKKLTYYNANHLIKHTLTPIKQCDVDYNIAVVVADDNKTSCLPNYIVSYPNAALTIDEYQTALDTALDIRDGEVQ